MAATTKLQVLVAEDNPINQRVLVALLQQQGHTGVVVSDGEQASRCLAQRTFDLLLLDMEMPVKTGIEVLAELRAAEAIRGGHLPVIFVTSNDMPDERVRCLALGADGYLCKPVAIAELEQEIATVLPRR